MKTRFREALIAHMTQAQVGATELSRATGVSKQIIDKLFQRRAEATNVEDAVKLARFFGKSVNQMIGDSMSDDEEARFRRVFALLSSAEREIVQAQLEGLLARKAPR